MRRSSTPKSEVTPTCPPGAPAAARGFCRDPSIRVGRPRSSDPVAQPAQVALIEIAQVRRSRDPVVLAGIDDQLRVDALSLQGVVLTMFDRRNNLCEMVAADVREYLGDRVYKTMIPRNVRVSEAPSHGKPVLLYDMRCAGAQAYIHLAREILQRENDLTGQPALAS